MMETLHTVLIGGALALYAILIVALVLKRGWAVARREGAAFCLIALCFLVSMATKPTTGTVTYPYTDVETRYLYDAGSYVTNDAVYVSFTRAAFVPDPAPLFGFVRPMTSTNDADWVEFLSTSFGAFPVPQLLSFPGAQTNDFIFFTIWTPGPAAHTNGVAVVYWRAASTNTAAPLRTGLYRDAVRVAPNPAITNSWPITINLSSESETE